MSVRLQLQGELHKLNKKKVEILKAGKASVNAARAIICPTILTPLEDIKLEEAQVHIKEALSRQQEFLRVWEDIKTIEKELE